MKWLQAFSNYFPEHKYAINSKLLGDKAELAWSNLGYWQADTSSYPQACQALADQLAQAIDLNAKDRLLDVGCGQGASLVYWHSIYQIQQMSAVEMQSACVTHLQKKLASTVDIHCGSFLNLNAIFPQKTFDAVLCIDAAYHSPLNSFLFSMHSVLNSKGRIGFHYLMWSDKYQDLNTWQKLRYQALLKAADVNIGHLLRQTDLQHSLEHFEFQNIHIQDMSLEVFAGFENYVATDLNSKIQSQGMDAFKIRMTAKLCGVLYQEGMVRYVQITAQKA